LLVDAVLPNSAVHYFPTRRSSDLLFITERGTTGLPSQQNDATGLNLTFQRDLWAGGSAAATGTAVNLPTGHVHSLVRGVRNFNKDRKSTRLNSSHVSISYAVICLK